MKKSRSAGQGPRQGPRSTSLDGPGALAQEQRPSRRTIHLHHLPRAPPISHELGAAWEGISRKESGQEVSEPREGLCRKLPSHLPLAQLLSPAQAGRSEEMRVLPRSELTYFESQGWNGPLFLSSFPGPGTGMGGFQT